MHTKHLALRQLSSVRGEKLNSLSSTLLLVQFVFSPPSINFILPGIENCRLSQEMLSVIYYPTIRLWKIRVNLIDKIEKHYRSGGNKQSKFFEKCKRKVSKQMWAQLLIPVKYEVTGCWPGLALLEQPEAVALTSAELHPFVAGWATCAVGSCLAGSVLLWWGTVLWRCHYPHPWLESLAWKCFCCKKAFSQFIWSFESNGGVVWERACFAPVFFFLMCNCFAYLCKVDFESLGILWLWLDLSCIICSLLSVLSQIYHSDLCNNYIQFLLITFNQRCEVSCPMLSGRPVG